MKSNGYVLKNLKLPISACSNMFASEIMQILILSPMFQRITHYPQKVLNSAPYGNLFPPSYNNFFLVIHFLTHFKLEPNINCNTAKNVNYNCNH